MALRRCDPFESDVTMTHDGVCVATRHLGHYHLGALAAAQPGFDPYGASTPAHGSCRFARARGAPTARACVPSEGTQAVTIRRGVAKRESERASHRSGLSPPPPRTGGGRPEAGQILSRMHVEPILSSMQGRAWRALATRRSDDRSMRKHWAFQCRCRFPPWAYGTASMIEDMRVRMHQ